MKLSAFSRKVSSVQRSYQPSDKLVMPTNLIGIEVEIEGVDVNDPVFSHKGTNVSMYWEAVTDHSLRNGAELRFITPLFGQDCVKAIDALDVALKKVDHVSSMRTSTHVHYDMVAFPTTQDLLKLLALAGLFEKVLFQYVGGDRADSIYCLPYEKSRGDFRLISTLAGDPRDIGEELGRYQAINLQSLFKHGTVEFRHAGALTTKEELLEWVNILGCLVKYASEDNFELKDLAGICSQKTPMEFLIEVFPDYYKKLLYPEVEYDILEGARLADDLIHMSGLNGQEAYRGLDGVNGGIFKEVFKVQLDAMSDEDDDDDDDRYDEDED